MNTVASRQRPLVLRLTTGVLALSLLAACATGGGSGQTSDAGKGGVTLEFPNFQASEAPFAQWWKEFVAAYEKKYPAVKVQMTDSLNSDRYEETLVTRFAAGNPPDIIQETTTNYYQLAGAGYLKQIDDFLKTTAVPERWGPLQDTYKWEGKSLGVLTLASGLILYYNQKLLDAAGVAVPKTAAELVKASQAIYDPKNGIYGFAGVSAPQDPKLYNESSAFVFGQGGAWYKGAQPNFTDPAVIDALGYYRDAIKTAPRGLQFSQRNALFQSGKAGFMIENANFTGAIKQKAPKDVLPFLKPAPLPFMREPGLASVFLGLPEGMSGAKLKAAEDFIRLAISPEWQQRYAEIVGAPAPDPNSITTLATKDPNMQLFAGLAAKAVSIMPDNPKVLKDFPVHRKTMFDALVTITSSSRSIGDVMAKLQSDVEAQLR